MTKPPTSPLTHALNHPKRWLITALGLAALTSSPALGLLFGLTLSVTLQARLTAHTRGALNELSKRLLKLAVVLLGAGVQLNVVLHVGRSSLGVTLLSISATMLLGALLGRLLKVDKTTSALISGGTAICGGSAIAALAPSLRATQAQTAIAMLVVFTLNALGLFLFPLLGEGLGLSEVEFGLWAALAIHDTSSVVGAATVYGGVALTVATTVKLTRALWILPLSVVSARLYGARSGAQLPWFLVGFLALAALRALCFELEGSHALFALLSLGGKRLMVSTLFLIGAGASLSELKALGPPPLLLALTLWLCVSVGALWLIKAGLVSVGL